MYCMYVPSSTCTHGSRGSRRASAQWLGVYFLWNCCIESLRGTRAHQAHKQKRQTARPLLASTAANTWLDGAMTASHQFTNKSSLCAFTYVRACSRSRTATCLTCGGGVGTPASCGRVACPAPAWWAGTRASRCRRQSATTPSSHVTLRAPRTWRCWRCAARRLTRR